MQNIQYINSVSRIWGDLEKIDTAYRHNHGAQARAGVILAAFDMIGMSWQLVKKGGNEFWQNYSVTAETVEALKEAGKYILLAICGITLGIFVPAFFVSMGQGLITQVIREVRVGVLIKKIAVKIFKAVLVLGSAMGVGYLGYQLWKIRPFTEEGAKQLSEKVSKVFTSLKDSFTPVKEYVESTAIAVKKWGEVVVDKLRKLQAAIIAGWKEGQPDQQPKEPSWGEKLRSVFGL